MSLKIQAQRALNAHCGGERCPHEVRALWAAAHLTAMRWDEYMQHPLDPHLQAKVGQHIAALRLAASATEPAMQVHPINPDCT